MKKIQGIVKGAMSYLKRPFILKFEESKPTVYKMQIVRGSVIKEDDIVAYAARKMTSWHTLPMRLMCPKLPS